MLNTNQSTLLDNVRKISDITMLGRFSSPLSRYSAIRGKLCIQIRNLSPYSGLPEKCGSNRVHILVTNCTNQLAQHLHQSNSDEPARHLRPPTGCLCAHQFLQMFVLTLGLRIVRMIRARVQSATFCIAQSSCFSVRQPAYYERVEYVDYINGRQGSSNFSFSIRGSFKDTDKAR